MQGTYRFHTNNGVINAKNIITNAGKANILNAIAGKTKGFATSMVAGVGSVTATVDDLALQFAVGGNDINAIITDLVNEKIYFKATLPALDNYKIYELGLFSINYTGAQNAFGAGSISLVTFGENTNWTDSIGASVLSSNNNRIGVTSIEYPSFSSVKGSMSFKQDLSILPDNATFDLAYFADNLSSLVLRFKFDDANYFQANTWTLTDGYNISKVLKSSFTATGSPSWNSLRTLEIQSAGTLAVLSLDALRYTVPINSEPIDSTLLSRVVLVTPQQKLAGVSMDVEYVLDLNI